MDVRPGGAESTGASDGGDSSRNDSQLTEIQSYDASSDRECAWDGSSNPRADRLFRGGARNQGRRNRRRSREKRAGESRKAKAGHMKVGM